MVTGGLLNGRGTSLGLPVAGVLGHFPERRLEKDVLVKRMEPLFLPWHALRSHISDSHHGAVVFSILTRTHERISGEAEVA